MYNCDVCQREFATDDSLLIHHSVVLECNEYLDYLVDYWIHNAVVEEEAIRQRSPKVVREMARESIRGDSGDHPWLACPDCAGRFFPHCVDMEAREQAHAYMKGENRAGFGAKESAPPEPGLEEVPPPLDMEEEIEEASEPESIGRARLLDERPERPPKDEKREETPLIDDEEEKKPEEEELEEAEPEKEPEEDTGTSAADILKSLGMKSATPPADPKDDLDELDDVELTDMDLGIEIDEAIKSGVHVDKEEDETLDLPEEDEDLQLDDEDLALSEDIRLDDEPAEEPELEPEGELEEEAPEPPRPEPPIEVPPGKIGVVCTCGKQMIVPESFGGRRFRCKGCGATVVVGTPDKEGAAEDILPKASSAVERGDFNEALEHLLEAMKVAPDDEEVRDLAAMILFRASRETEKIKKELLEDNRFDQFFSECSGCGRTWIPNPIAVSDKVSKEGGVCKSCAAAYCSQCAEEGGEVCKSCESALAVPIGPTGRTPKGPVDTEGLMKILLLHEAPKFGQPDLNRILSKIRPELKIRGVKFALFPQKTWPDQIEQQVAMLAQKHAKGTDLSRLRHETITDPGSDKLLCLVYCYE